MMIPLLLAIGTPAALAETLFQDSVYKNSAGETLASAPMRPSESWNGFQEDLVGDAIVQDGYTLFEVITPFRAAEQTAVPVQIRQIDPSIKIHSAMLVIDENPAPLATRMVFGEAMPLVNFAVRVRLNEFSNIRVIAQTDHGLFMSGRFVRASGAGACAAPPISDPASIAASMGKMRLKHFGQAEETERKAQLMIRHPNFSGMQRDQITNLDIPAHFLHKTEVYQSDALLFSMESGISISENPVVRFEYEDDGSTSLHVQAKDTNGNTFNQQLSKDGQS